MITPQGRAGEPEASLNALQPPARGALEDNVKRVEKIHHVSTAMIEESSLRSQPAFVLVGYWPVRGRYSAPGAPAR